VKRIPQSDHFNSCHIQLANGGQMKLAMILCLVFLETTYVGSGIGTCLIIFALG